MFNNTTGRHALYIALLGLAFPVMTQAGGIDDDIEPHAPGRADNNAPIVNQSRQLDPAPSARGRHLRPAFGNKNKNTAQPGNDGKLEQQPFGKRHRNSDRDHTADQGQDRTSDLNSGLDRDHPTDLDRNRDRNRDKDRDRDLTQRDQTDAPAAYTKAVRSMIRKSNRQGLSTGHIKLYAKNRTWGAGVKIQDCFGDNILTKFTVKDRGASQGLTFQMQGVRRKNSRIKRGKWRAIEPGSLIKGRYIHLRARARVGSGVVTLRVVGICIDDPPR